MSEEVKYEDRVRAAYRSAQGNVAQEFSPHIVKACEASSNARMERLATGQTTFDEEEAALMKKWKEVVPLV
ncbi:MAG: hypothetical protein I4N51_00075 [Acinetobacter sp.]|nr:hypothetical protein [Acinetobacter sp.]